MGKRRRNTAKTGDKALYKARTAAQGNADDGGNEDVDPMYDEVDRFHNDKDKDFLKLSNTADDDSSSDDDQEEAVMDLAVGGESSSSSSSSDDDDDSSSSSSSEETGEQENDLSSTDDDQDEDEEEMAGVRDWGRKKSSYYHGDTADLEIGQDEEDAYLEEEAAKEVQKARYEEMSEDDFLLSEDAGSDAEEEARASSSTEITLHRDISKLTSKQKKKLLDRKHPELLPLLAHFSGITEDLSSRTAVASRAILDGEEGTAQSVGATRLGQQYLLTKAMAQTSAALNLAMYLLLKFEQVATDDSDDGSLLIQNHPVMIQLQKLNTILQDVEDKVEHKSLIQQLDHVVKAAELLGGNHVDDDDESESGNEDGGNNDVSGTEEGKRENEKPAFELPSVEEDQQEDADSESSESDSDGSQDEAARARTVLNEARFGLRQSDLVHDPVRAKRRRVHGFDAGDDDEEEGRQKTAAKSLATTLNTIEQRTNSRKRQTAPLAEDLDDHEEDDGELRRGLEMMEAELGKALDDDLEGVAVQDPEMEDDVSSDVNDFYAQVSKRSKERKQFKKELHRVAPKFPRVEGEIEGERAISKQILKNRGLVAHKSKDNRNPRVKKRKQYDKALIRRKGAVRDIRTDEGHKYGGEETGIKTGISRSRKLAR